MKQTLFLLSLITLSHNLYAWGPDGHKIVGQIAEDHLTRTAKTKITQILGGASLASVSNWADSIKGDPNWDHSKPWHYVNLADGENYETSDHHADGDIIVAIKEMVKILKNPSTSVVDKEVALKFIVHFVGDIHQPLHVGRADDQGGNAVKVIFKGRNMNLHSLWDSGMITLQKMDYIKYSRYLQGLSFVTPTYEIPELPLKTILQEGMNSRKEIYNFSALTNGPIKLEESYMKRNLSNMNSCLLLGGKRLAGLLNAVFK